MADTLLDTDTIDEVAAAFRRTYSRALEIAAPRIWARMRHFQALVAADSADQQTITDEEWELLVGDTEDSVGDAVLDGAVAGAVTLGVLAAPAVIARRIAEHLSGLINYSPSLRAKIDKWIETTIATESPETLEALIELLRVDSPLSPDKADLVAATETQSAGNAGIHVAGEASPPAAVRWVTQRDLRVRFYHAVADTDTVPYGTDFTIGGYPARYPGDPQLPFDLRVNCRCELAYVDGNEVRRAIGATKSELRSKASELDITGRSKMNKGELQHAVLKALCLQGLAGGPDCPDKLDKMNRTALLTLARGQGIRGRHRMSRQELLAALRGELHGTEPGRIAAGFATDKARGRAVKRAGSKVRHVPDQAGSGKTPSLAARRSARARVFAEFDEGDGYVPCVHCGLRLHDDPRQGFAMLVPEPIVPWSEGGTLELENLLPSCPSCFRARGGRGLVGAATVQQLVAVFTEFKGKGYVDVPRDWHGRWTRPGGQGPSFFGPPPHAANVKGAVRQMHPGVTIELDDKGDHWELSRLIVPKERRGQGEGSTIMWEITASADWAGVPITLTPEPIGGGSKKSLERFYKDHGFVKNKGKHKLWSSRDSMVRYPAGMTAAAEVPRDGHGRWCKGAQCSASTHEVREVENPRAAFLAFIDDEALKKQKDHDLMDHGRRRETFDDALSTDEREAWEEYQDWMYAPLNKGMRYGEWKDDELPADRIRDLGETLKGTFAKHGDAGPTVLFRAQSTGRRAALDFEVGQQYQDNGFGSWTGEVGTARAFTGMTSGSFDDREHNNSLFITMQGGSMVKSIPGTPYELETIMPPGSRYEVTRIIDFVPGTPPKGKAPATDHHRYMEVDLLDE